MPQYFVEIAVNTANMRVARQQINDSLPADASGRVSYTDFLLQAMAAVGADCPELGMIWQDGKPPELLEAGTANIGLIVALEEGMLIPVITGVDRLILTELAEKRAETVKAARASRLGSRYAAPCAISLSNLGATGVDRFQAIVEPGQTAVLAVGSERRTALVDDDEIVAGRAITLVLSVDHRVVDGAVAGRFMARLKARLESDDWLRIES